MDLANLDAYFVDPTPEMFTDEHAHDYSFPSRFDVYPDDLLEVESDADNFYDDPFDSKGEKIKESKLLIDELDFPCDFLPYSEYDSFTSQDFSKDDDFPSPNNKDKDFDHPFYEPFVFKDVPNLMRLLPFSSENEEKVFKPGIYTSEKLIDLKQALRGRHPMLISILELSLAGPLPVSSRGTLLGSTTLACKVIVTLNRFKATMRETLWKGYTKGLLQPLDLTVHDLNRLFSELELVIDLNFVQWYDKSFVGLAYLQVRDIKSTVNSSQLLWEFKSIGNGSNFSDNLKRSNITRVKLSLFAKTYHSIPWQYFQHDLIPHLKLKWFLSYIGIALLTITGSLDMALDLDNLLSFLVDDL
uniref:Reverse transcriptase domain-containing protein n=1 Tax=Tanacetum cinerariifolium TaxID=118510 RepID=A0A6L2KDQ9_TANCI|nr:hypothetical protein [Tanacetum cinerariifolium]